MNTVTRRRFMSWTGAGAAGASLLALAPRLFGRDATMPAPADQRAPALASGSLASFDEPIVAYVHAPATGELSLMVGTREVAVTDPDLVGRLIERVRNGR